MDIDQKWKIVLEHYTKGPFKDNFGVVHRPKPHKIEWLYRQKLKLDEELAAILERRDVNVRRFLNWDFDR